MCARGRVLLAGVLTAPLARVNGLQHSEQSKATVTYPYVPGGRTYSKGSSPYPC